MKDSRWTEARTEVIYRETRYRSSGSTGVLTAVASVTALLLHAICALLISVSTP